jgi:hypothetical protein
LEDILQGLQDGTTSARPHAEKTAEGPQPVALYFNVVVWGESYRRYFLRFLLPSLLSPGNIPALEDRALCKFLIATTQADWAIIQEDPVFQRLTSLVAVIHHEFPMPSDDDNKYLVMSAGHCWASELTFRDQAYGVFVTPDLMLSDGSVATLERLAKQGRNVVLCAAIRFSTEGMLPDIENRYRTSEHDPLVLDARGLMDVALANKHPETLRYEYESAWLADMPWTLYWRVPDATGILLHTYSWAPLLVNYAAIDDHDTKTFENWTLDGDYIYRNFWQKEGIYVVQDSDEIILVSFTPHDDLPNVPFDPRHPYWQKYLVTPMVGKFLRNAFLRNVFHIDTIDELKRSLFALPVKFHSGPLSTRWDRVERRAARAIADASRPPRASTLRLRNAMVVPVDLNAEAAFLYEAVHIKFPGSVAKFVSGAGGLKFTRFVAGAISWTIETFTKPFVYLHMRKHRQGRDGWS